MGNKNDCPEKKVVKTEDATTFSDQIGVELYETSAKENINVEEVRDRKEGEEGGNEGIPVSYGSIFWLCTCAISHSTWEKLELQSVEL